MQITEAQMNRTASDWNEIAQEPVRVENISGALYAFGSELACLRLFHKYNQCARAHGTRTAFSKPMQTWFFSLEPRF